MDSCSISVHSCEKDCFLGNAEKPLETGTSDAGDLYVHPNPLDPVPNLFFHELEIRA